MKQTLLTAFVVALLAACGQQTNKEPELQQNTEEYFRAHGIVQGQVNELRIGSTLFRFPAEVGLNPYTATGIPLLMDGGKGTPLAKEPKKIVKGQADRVTFYLDGDQSFQPKRDPYGSRGGDATIRVQISSGYVEKSDRGEISQQQNNPRTQRDVPNLGLKEFIFTDERNPANAQLFYLAANVKTPRGNAVAIHCEPRYDSTKGFLNEPAYCAVTYQTLQGFAVTYGFGGHILLPKWQEIHHAVTRFIDSVIVK